MMTDYSPAPPRLAVQAPTPETVKAGIQLEKKMKQIKIATDQALVVFKHHNECRPFASLVGEQAVEEHIPARVFAAMAVIESTCNPAMVSSTKDYGVWQINAKYHPYPIQVLKDPRKNAAIAAHFLRRCINEAGSVEEGLHRYNGLGRPAGEYSGAVLAVAYGRPS